MRWPAAALALLGATFPPGARAESVPKEAPAPVRAEGKEAAAAPARGRVDLSHVELTVEADVGPWTSGDWVGTTDGASLGVGFALRGGAHARRGDHTFGAELGMTAGLGRSFEVAEVVKSRDALSLHASYVLALAGWFGPLARLTIDTSAFAGSDVQETTVLRRIERVDGSVETRRSARLPLTDPLRPLVFGQSLGPLLRPVASRPIAVFLHGGAGARETLAEGQRVIDDRASTLAVEARELIDLAQVGGDGGLAIRGTIDDVGVRYLARASVLVPFAHTRSLLAPREGLTEAMTIDVESEIGLRLSEWASLDYGFRAIREPLLVDAFRFQSGLRLTVAFQSVFGQDEVALAFP